MSDHPSHARNWDATRSYDRNVEKPTEAVVRAVARATGRDELAIDPLYGVVDTDALDSFVAVGSGSDVAIEFRYVGCRVYVDGECVAVDCGD